MAKSKINRTAYQLKILVNAYRYYVLCRPTISDLMFDNIVAVYQNIKGQKGKYDYAFEGFDGSTTEYLLNKLNPADLAFVKEEAIRGE